VVAPRTELHTPSFCHQRRERWVCIVFGCVHSQNLREFAPHFHCGLCWAFSTRYERPKRPRFSRSHSN
jgi:hypothetical protein